MLHLRTTRGWLVGLVVVLAACGGGGGGGGGDGGGGTDAPPPAAPGPLVASVSTLALAVSGQARVVTLTNQGAIDAVSLQSSLTPALPAGTTLTTDCTTLAPGASCRFTFTPGAAPTAATGAPSAPVVLSVAGTNTNTVTTDVHVLTHGSVYQSGYVFSLDDSTPSSGSVGGKAAALSDASAAIWSSNGTSGSPLDVAMDHVLGIDETDTAAGGGCDARTDGRCNAQAITAFYAGVNMAYYAAGTCTLPMDGHSDWYLPAICEIGNGVAAGCVAGDSMQSRLIDNGALTPVQLPRVPYWSSTTVKANPGGTAWAQTMNSGNANQAAKDLPLRVRCARGLTP